MRIYLDNCCFNRPYDDLRDDKVRMEAEAVVTIIDICEGGKWELCGSDILLDEIENAADIVKKQKILMLYRTASVHIDITAGIVARAKEIERFGAKPYDSLHLASAEAGGADVFLTTDRKLLNAAKRANAAMETMNPLIWLAEALYDER